MGYLHLPARIENWRAFVVDDAVTLSKIKRAEGLYAAQNAVEILFRK